VLRIFTTQLLAIFGHGIQAGLPPLLCYYVLSN